jgi:phage terminase small subunit
MTGRKVKSPKSTGKITKGQAANAIKAVKLTDKQDAFCLAYVKCNNASEAYRECYNVKKDAKPEGIWVDAYKLMANPNVALRVHNLQEAAQERTLVTVESLTLELDEAKAMAIKMEQASAITGAVMGKAKLHGLDVQKVDMVGRVDIRLDSADIDL